MLCNATKVYEGAAFNLVLLSQSCRRCVACFGFCLAPWTRVWVEKEQGRLGYDMVQCMFLILTRMSAPILTFSELSQE
jgi:hypothetical protein